VTKSPPSPERGPALVVALLGIVERRAHEVGEGDGPLARDPLAEPLGESVGVNSRNYSFARCGSPQRIRFAAAALLLCVLAACSSRPDGPYPTLEDYSDGTSRFAEELLEGWKAGTPRPRSSIRR
jgi:hypothetical protein